MTNQPDNLQAFDDFLDGREQPEEEREPKQFIVSTPRTGPVDIWADSADTKEDGRLEFYRETRVIRTIREVIGRNRNLLFSWPIYGDVAHEEVQREVIAVFQPMDWCYYFLVDDQDNYGGIDPDMLIVPEVNDDHPA